MRVFALKLWFVHFVHNGSMNLPEGEIVVILYGGKFLRTTVEKLDGSPSFHNDETFGSDDA